MEIFHYTAAIITHCNLKRRIGYPKMVRNTFNLRALQARHAELTFFRVLCLFSTVPGPCVVGDTALSELVEDMPVRRGSSA